jgi:hypothetical protein
MTTKERLHAAEQAARRRGKLRHAGGAHELGQAITARKNLSDLRGGRVWINGREVDGTAARYAYLASSHD